MSVPGHVPPTKWASVKARDRRRSRHAVRAVIVTALASLASVVLAPVAGASSSHANRTPDVGIVPFAGDVFTVSSTGSLIAVDPRQTPPSAALFNLAGTPLNLTWGQFTSATASSLAKAITTLGIAYTDFRITIGGLIPGGVYSLFYRTFNPDSNNSLCPNVDGLAALTARHPEPQQPDADSFIADSSGAARFRARVAGRLLDAQNVEIDVIYHFDGNVYGPVPTRGEANNNCRSSFGIDAMRQLLIIQK